MSEDDKADMGPSKLVTKSAWIKSTWWAVDRVELDPPVFIWEPVGPVPTVTVTVERSDEWTELGT